MWNSTAAPLSLPVQLAPSTFATTVFASPLEGADDVPSPGYIERTATLSDGTKMPLLGLGTESVDADSSRRVVLDAVDCGYRRIDSAMHHPALEREVGAALSTVVRSGKVARSDLFISSKLWLTDIHPENVLPATRACCERLGVSYLDLLSIHWPVAWKQEGSDRMAVADEPGELPALVCEESAAESAANLVATWAAMETLVAAGLVRSLGLCNASPSDLDCVLLNCKKAPVINQVECHPYLNQRELRGSMAAAGIRLCAYSPLGVPRRPPPPGRTQPCVLDDSALLQVAKRRGCTAAQAVLRWHLQRGTAVVVTSTSAAHIAENADVWAFQLDEGDFDVIDEMGQQTTMRLNNPPYRPRGVVMFPGYPSSCCAMPAACT